MPYECVQCVAPLPPAERGKPFILSNDPKGKNFLYCTGNSVVIRDINNPSIADIYTEHSVKTTVAKYAPSGYYIASADRSGKAGFKEASKKFCSLVQGSDFRDQDADPCPSQVG